MRLDLPFDYRLDTDLQVGGANGERFVLIERLGLNREEWVVYRVGPKGECYHGDYCGSERLGRQQFKRRTAALQTA